MSFNPNMYSDGTLPLSPYQLAYSVTNAYLMNGVTYDLDQTLESRDDFIKGREDSIADFNASTNDLVRLADETRLEALEEAIGGLI